MYLRRVGSCIRSEDQSSIVAGRISVVYQSGVGGGSWSSGASNLRQNHKIDGSKRGAKNLHDFVNFLVQRGEDLPKGPFLGAGQFENSIPNLDIHETE